MYSLTLTTLLRVLASRAFLSSPPTPAPGLSMMGDPIYALSNSLGPFLFVCWPMSSILKVLFTDSKLVWSIYLPLMGEPHWFSVLSAPSSPSMALEILTFPPTFCIPETEDLKSDTLFFF